jgi:hypothetical protein
VDEAQRKQMQAEMIMTLLSTLIFLVLYWWSTLPEWKREALLMELRQRLRLPKRGDGLSLADRLTLNQFRLEMSRWEHARKRYDGMASRDNDEKGNQS